MVYNGFFCRQSHPLVDTLNRSDLFVWSDAFYVVHLNSAYTATTGHNIRETILMMG